MKIKIQIYLTSIILSVLLLAMVISSIAWFTVNLEVESTQATLTSSNSLGLNISIPTEYENEDSYMGQTGLQYEGLDSPYVLTYDPIEVNIQVGSNKEYYLYSDISAVEVDTVTEEVPIVLSEENIAENFTWRYGSMRKVFGLNPETGIEEYYYVERFYKNNNGFLYDTETGEPYKVYDEQNQSLTLYLIFLGEEGYSLMQQTQENISAQYKFEFSDVSYMWATFKISVNIGVRELYTINFNSMGGSSCSSIETTGGEEISLPQTTIEDDTKYFGGWYDNMDFSNQAYEDNSLVENPINSNLTLYAKWIDKAVLSFDANGYPGAMPSSQYIIPGEIGFEPEMQETIYWTTSPMSYDDYMASPQPFDFDTIINEDITLYAVWQPRYTITLHMVTNNSGYLVVGEQEYHDTYTFEVYEGDTIPNIYTPIPNSSYHSFKKWSLEGNALTYLSASTYNFDQPIYEDTHLYAYYGL